MGYHINVSALFSVLDFSKNTNNNEIDRIDIHHGGWTKYWRITEIPDMLGEVAAMNIKHIKIIRDYAERETVLDIEVA